MVEVPRLQRGGHRREVALVHLECLTVRRRVPAGEGGIGGLQLQPEKLKARHPMAEAETRHPRAAAKFQNLLPCPRRDGGGKQHRIGCGAIARTRLGDRKAPAEERIRGDLVPSEHSDLDPVVPQDGSREEQVSVANHDATRQNAKGTFEHAHVDVHLKRRYTLTGKERCGESDGGRVSCAQKLFHDHGHKDEALALSR